MLLCYLSLWPRLLVIPQSKVSLSVGVAVPCFSKSTTQVKKGYIHICSVFAQWIETELKMGTCS